MGAPSASTLSLEYSLSLCAPVVKSAQSGIGVGTAETGESIALEHTPFRFVPPNKAKLFPTPCNPRGLRWHYSCSRLSQGLVLTRFGVSEVTVIPLARDTLKEQKEVRDGSSLDSRRSRDFLDFPSHCWFRRRGGVQSDLSTWQQGHESRRHCG